MIAGATINEWGGLETARTGRKRAEDEEEVDEGEVEAEGGDLDGGEEGGEEFAERA
eukprot:CAMPEP_0197420126 /NCGR_PEP_ID=MMETSP1170-20131217/5598_1 /TAXON_ID=54406 /ORGANISM="Sarcinochrysis sp, Strain CCMP770" /LENGTH=55 /DNA_ID=CAMNT_0042947259 /DNA_START=137 /DNA_END=301 /DNA_ORIENTATION=+